MYLLTTAESPRAKPCNDAATKWAMKTMKAYGAGSARFTAVCVVK